jgi:hypothetical protein
MELLSKYPPRLDAAQVALPWCNGVSVGCNGECVVFTLFQHKHETERSESGNRVFFTE